MIKINLYDYQRVSQEVTVQKMVMTAGMIVLGVMAFTVMTLIADITRVSIAESEAQEAQAKVTKIKPKYDVVVRLKAEEGDLNTKITSLSSLRSSKIPFATLMEDVGQVTPSGVWLDKIEQKTEAKLRGSNVPILFIAKGKKGPKKDDPNAHLFIKFSGKASSDRGVVRFMEGLETLSYLDHVLMHTSTQSWIANRSVRNFIVYAHVMGTGPKPKK